MREPFIIAEMSANHLGSLDRAHKIVESAAAAGADAIKLQTWTPGTMCVDKTYEINHGPWAGSRLADLYDQAFTPWEWHQELYEHANNLGMIAFSSVFDLLALQFLESIECPIYKISSFEITDIPLIQSVARTGKPMIISTGMATFTEIAQAWSEAWRSGCRDITILKCTSAYPANCEDANLDSIRILRAAIETDRTKIGVSDHTMGLAVPIAATALGATVIEKHLTLLRSDGGPDSKFSLEPDEFRQMAIECRNTARAIRGQKFGPGPEEHHDLRRSTYIARDMIQGEVITEAHLTTARPALGMPPAKIPDCIGKMINRNVLAGTPMHQSMAVDKAVN